MAVLPSRSPTFAIAAAIAVAARSCLIQFFYARAFVGPCPSGGARRRPLNRHPSLLRLSSLDDTVDDGFIISVSGGSPSKPPPSPPTVLCVGETLWDSLPSGIYLGGAPSNVAVHLASLFNNNFASTPDDSNNDLNTVAIAACLGQDRLGLEARRRLSIKGVRTDYLQLHKEWETGMSTAIIDAKGDANYEFITPAAWDGLRMEEKLSNLIRPQKMDDSATGGEEERQDVIFVMGTIAGRLQNDHGATSASTLARIRNDAPEGTVVMDVNLRSPWYDPELVLDLARGAASSSEEGNDDNGESSPFINRNPKKLALLKLNEEELCTIERWCGLEDNTTSTFEENNDSLSGASLERRMEWLTECLNAERVCVTRGKDGAALLCKDNRRDEREGACDYFESAGFRLTVGDNDSDTVGAGDAFLAALVNSLFIRKESPKKSLERACALGGYVAGCRGGTPEHADAPEDLRLVFSG